jgi:dihydrofolate reductase
MGVSVHLGHARRYRPNRLTQIVWAVIGQLSLNNRSIVGYTHGGPSLAAQALVAGLVEEVVLFVWPVLLGGRNPALQTDTRVDLELIEERRFDSGVVQLRFSVP